MQFTGRNGTDSPILEASSALRCRDGLRGGFYALLGVTAVFLAVSNAKAEDSKQAPQTTVKKDDTGITRQQADEILNELKQIRQLLERQSRPQAPVFPQRGKLKLDGGVSLGATDAPVAIVEFMDFECPFCRQFQNSTFPELRKKYVDTGKVRFVVREFPLSIHANAMRAAEGARCAGDQGKYWPMHDSLFSDPSRLSDNGLVDNAKTLQLDVEVFRSCMESGKHKLDIQKDVQVGNSLQIMATPSFLIGKINGEEVEGPILVGAPTLSAFELKLKEIGTPP